jgi:flagellar basal-body rod protein FlgC
MEFIKSIKISAAGMQAQGIRLRVISENVANAQSLGTDPGAEPYRRKQVTFRNVLDRNLQTNKVQIDRILTDNSAFARKFDPTHPAADENGYVLMPNVNTLVEMADMREASRSYEANLGAIEVSKQMLNRTIDLLRN